jgi:predicted branched-subunit amino acid permease
MHTATNRDEFWRGVREMLGPSLGISAWALVTGVAMVKSGLSIPVASAMSLFVYAGSAQLAALPLIAAGAPLWVLFATAFCVNMRFVIFSAQWRKYFGHLPRSQRLLLGYMAVDLSYVLFMRRFPKPRPTPEQLPYFWGGVTWNWFSWQVPSLVGIVLADRVPTEWGLEFAGVLALLGVAYSLLSGRKSWVAGAVASIAAVAAFGFPLKLNIVVAITAGVAVGMLLDRWFPGADAEPRT